MVIPNLKFTSLAISIVLLLAIGCKTVNNAGLENLNEVNKISGSWIVTSIKGIDVNEEFKERKPQLNIDIAENKVAGYGGCNNYFGKISVEGDSIKIGPLGATMMACPTMQAEYKYMKFLENADSYSVDDLRLTLILKGEPILIYEKHKSD
jgi:heat shock protein HslJ